MSIYAKRQLSPACFGLGTLWFHIASGRVIRVAITTIDQLLHVTCWLTYLPTSKTNPALQIIKDSSALECQCRKARRDIALAISIRAKIIPLLMTPLCYYEWLCRLLFYERFQLKEIVHGMLWTQPYVLLRHHNI